MPSTSLINYKPCSSVAHIYFGMVLILCVFLAFANEKTLEILQARGLLLWPGKTLIMKYKSEFDQSYIVDSRKIYIDANNTNYCDYVYIDEEADIPKAYLDLYDVRQHVSISLYRISNIFVTPMPLLGTMNYTASIFNASNKNMNIYPERGNFSVNFFENNTNFRFEKEVDCIVHTGCPWLDVYGHLIWDIFNPLLLLPNTILSRCTLFIPKVLKDYATSALGNLYGIQETRLIFFNYQSSDMTKWYFTRDLYLFDGRHDLENYQILSPTFIKLAKQKYNISQIDPYRYFLHNREAQYSRRVISNFDELCNDARATFPNIDWECETPETRSFREIIQFYHEVKLYFTPTGSDVFHALFMQPNTVVIDAMSAQFNCNDVSVCHSSKVNLIIFRWPALLWHQFGGPIPIPSDLFLRNIKFGLNVLSNETFREEHRKFKGKSQCWN